MFNHLPKATGGSASEPHQGAPRHQASILSAGFFGGKNNYDLASDAEQRGGWGCTKAVDKEAS